MHPTEKILSWSPVQITGLANCIGLSVIYLEESVCVADGRKLKCWSDKERRCQSRGPWSVLSLILQLSKLPDSRSGSDHSKPLLALLSSLHWGVGESRGVECVGIASAVCLDTQSIHQTSVSQVTVGNREDSNILHICSAMPGYTGNLRAAHAKNKILTENFTRLYNNLTVKAILAKLVQMMSCNDKVDFNS